MDRTISKSARAFMLGIYLPSVRAAKINRELRKSEKIATHSQLAKLRRRLLEIRQAIEYSDSAVYPDLGSA
jgi:hypothetical protein